MGRKLDERGQEGPGGVRLRADGHRGQRLPGEAVRGRGTHADAPAGGDPDARADPEQRWR